MSWEAMMRSAGGRSSAHVSFGIYSSGVRGLYVSIRIGADMMATLGWRRRDFVTVALGRFEHAGQLRLAPAGASIEPNRYKLTGYADCDIGMLKLRLWPELVAQKHASTDCRHAARDGALELTVPQWARRPAPPLATIGGAQSAARPRAGPCRSRGDAA
jgi:hypothetical protein